MLVVDTAIFDNTIATVDTETCTRDTSVAELPDSVYKARLQALPFIVEMPYNSVVRAFILRYVQRSPKQLARIQRKAAYYFPIFYDALGRNGLPYELCYLPVIESALNPQAFPAGRDSRLCANLHRGCLLHQLRRPARYMP